MTPDLNEYRKKGYGVCQKILSPELISETGAFLEREMEHCLQKIKGETGIERFDQWASGIDTLKAAGKLEQLSHEIKNILCGHFRLETRLDDALKRVALDPGLIALVRSILGEGRLGLHMPPAARFVLPGNNHAGVPAHQDISYNRHLGNFITVWVPMVDIDEQCGGVTFFEGEQPPIPKEDPREDGFWLEPVSVEGLTPVAPTLARGDCLVLGPRIVHQSSPNCSDRVRISVDYRFFLVEGPTSKHFMDLQTGEIIAPSHSRST